MRYMALTAAWLDGQELQLQTRQSCTALGLKLSTQRPPHLNVLLVLATAPTLPDFWLSLQDKLKVRRLGARLQLPFNPPRVTVPQLPAGSMSDSLCKAAHRPLMQGSETRAQAAPHVPKQPQGLSAPVINPHPMSLQAHLFLVSLACP